VIIEMEGAVFGMNMGCPIVTNGDGDTLFPNNFEKDLFYSSDHVKPTP